MTITIISAMTSDRVIGHKGALPWKMPSDLKRFKTVTLGHSIVMGSRTFQSFPKRPLPGRENLVLTKRNALKVADQGGIPFPTVEELLRRVNGKDLFIIGGASVYERFLSFADVLDITFVSANIQGDTHFPLWNVHEWEPVTQKERPVQKEGDEYASYQMTYRRKRQ